MLLFQVINLIYKWRTIFQKYGAFVFNTSTYRDIPELSIQERTECQGGLQGGEIPYSVAYRQSQGVGKLSPWGISTPVEKSISTSIASGLDISRTSKTLINKFIHSNKMVLG